MLKRADKKITRPLLQNTAFRKSSQHTSKCRFRPNYVCWLIIKAETRLCGRSMNIYLYTSRQPKETYQINNRNDISLKQDVRQFNTELRNYE